MTELTGVISSTGLPGVVQADEGVCPRELIGLQCISSEYDCLCEQVATVETETVKTKGHASSLVMRMSLDPDVGNPLTVMTALNLTGRTADFQVSRGAVQATFNLRRAENAQLASFVAEAGV